MVICLANDVFFVVFVISIINWAMPHPCGNCKFFLGKGWCQEFFRNINIATAIFRASKKNHAIIMSNDCRVRSNMPLSILFHSMTFCVLIKPTIITCYLQTAPCLLSCHWPIRSLVLMDLVVNPLPEHLPHKVAVGSPNCRYLDHIPIGF